MWVVLIASAALAACGGGSDSVSEPTSSPRNFVSAQAAMEASAASYQAEVQSFEGTMSIGFGVGGEDFSTDGELKFESPDKAYVSMDIPTLGDMEVLLNDNDIYFGLDGEWYTGDTSLLGINLEEFRKYAEDQGPVNYVDALEGLTDIVKLSDETIDGETYWHYHAALDLDALADEIPSDVIDPGLIDQAADALSGTSMDIYIDPETLLPRRYTMELTMEFAQEEFTMTMAMDFLEYNGDVDMPDAPTDAKEFDLSDFADFGS
jgi:hypothetical protein